MIDLIGKSRMFYNVSVFIDEFKLAAGINMFNHYKSLIAFFKKMTSKNFESPDSPPYEIPMKTKKETTQVVHKEENSPKHVEYQEFDVNWWDKYRMKFHGLLGVKLQRINLDILTHTSPFREDCLRLSTGMIYFSYQSEKFTLMLENISLLRLEENVNPKNTESLGIREGQTAIIQVPQVEMVIKLKWHSIINDHYCVVKSLQKPILPIAGALNVDHPMRMYMSQELGMEVKVNIPHKEKAYNTQIYPLGFEEGELGKLVYSSPVPILHYQTSLFSDLVSLPQLSHEYLMLNGIRLVSYKAIDQGASAAQSTLKKSAEKKKNMKMEEEVITPQAGKDGSRTNKQAMETITKLFTQGEFAEEFTSYIDLIAFALDQQINVKGKPNLAGWVSEIDFKLYGSVFRVLMTNMDQIATVNANLTKKSSKKKSAPPQPSKSGFFKKNDTKTTTEKTQPEEKENKNQYRICGVQAVINSVELQSIFYKKEVVYY